MNIKAILSKGMNFVSDNSNVILAGLGTAGVVSSVIFSVKVTPKALQSLDEAAYDKYVYEMDEMIDQVSYLDWMGFDYKYHHPKEYFHRLTKTEIIKATWKYYTPVVAMVGISIACIFGSTCVSNKRNAALASAYSLVEKTMKDYESKVIENLGEEKNKEIRKSISQKKLEDCPITEEVVPYGSGSYLCFDGITGRYFKADTEKIREAVNDFNYTLINDIYQDLNDWYLTLGLPSVMMGDLLGWNSDELLEISFDSQIATNGQPCIVLDYLRLPSPFYRK